MLSWMNPMTGTVRLTKQAAFVQIFPSLTKIDCTLCSVYELKAMFEMQSTIHSLLNGLHTIINRGSEATYLRKYINITSGQIRNTPESFLNEPNIIKKALQTLKA